MNLIARSTYIARIARSSLL